MSRPQPSRTAVCTIVSKNYLAHARTLMASVRVVHPQWEPYVLLVDEPEGLFDPAQEHSRIVRLEELDLPERQKFLYRYTLLEMNTAVKPWLLEWLFGTTGADQVIYLDPDIYVYQPLADVLDLLGRGALMVLTPHLTEELNDGKRPGERDILRAGCYNLGFLALAQHADLSRFLAWWRGKLELDCRVDPAEGLFVDQRWMDLAPGLFADVAVLRHPGYNVAYWNLHHRHVRLVDGLPHVGDGPLVFFHFSGFNPARPHDLSKHQNRFSRHQLGAAGVLLDRYGHAMLSNGWETCSKWSYAYGALQDGTPISDSMRRYYRTHLLVQQRVGPNPFADPHDYLNEPWGSAAGPLVTRLMRQVWEERSDLKEAFPDIDGAWREDFVHHFIADSAAEAGVADRFVAPAREGLRAWHNRERSSVPAPRTPALTLCAPLSVEREPSHPLTRIIRFVAKSVIALVPLPMTTDRARRLARLLRPVGRLLPEAVRRQLRLELRLWLNRRRAIRRTLFASLRDGLANCVRKALQLLRLVHHTPPPAGAPAAPESAPDEAGGMILTIADDQLAAAGVNIIGYVRAETGVGESVRLCAQAAKAANLPFALLEAHSAGAGVRDGDGRWAGQLDERARYPVSLVHVNADVMSAAPGPFGPGARVSRYVIGYWHWELPEFPDRWLGAFDRVDEVWVPTRFIQDAVSARSPRPVVRIPHGISFHTYPGVTRADLGLPAGRFLFLTMYDAESYQARKNPEGAIEAFRLAFGASRDVSLVVKVNNPNNHPAVARLKALAKRLPNLVVIDRAMPRQQVYELLRLCDCFVSLHRSEGFGLGLAEAMFLGKPVVATGWSGNVDFMSPENSCPVRYRLVPLKEDVGPYDRGQLWADPDLEHAATFMRKLVAEPGWRQQIGASGRATIRAEYSPEHVGLLYARRLDEIHRLLRQGGRKARRAAA